MPLFHPRVIEKHTQKMLPVESNHSDILNAWASNLAKGIYDSETQNDSEFIQQILINILGYVGSSEGENWTVAKNQPINQLNVDVALGEFSAENVKIIAPFELKGAKTKDLDAIMAGRGKTPVQQAWEYANEIQGGSCQWVIVSNYREIRLYAFGFGKKHYESFNLAKLTNPENYKHFMLLLSAENLLSGLTLGLLKESELVDKDITNQLYADYKALRANLIKTLGQDNSEKDPLEIIKYTQTILDRVLFVAFAEDKGLLPKNTLKNAYETQNNFNPQPIWDNFKGLFNAIDKGNSTLKIPHYNGGLFAKNGELDSLIISDELCKAFKKIGDYDFDSDVSVNILGHIFEQSISDLEELKAHADNIEEVDPKKSKRKKDGIFYTPPYITRYIVEQAVGGWLNDRRQELDFDALPELKDDDYASIKMIERGKRKGQITFNKKIGKHIEFWEAYKEKLSNIKVLDPACGSGAFLNEVFDYLKIEGEAVNNELSILKGGQTSVFRWDTHILANNIYGVDLNNESVEITKLSLWLKTANRQEKLTYLENNIKCGNSLIDDVKIAGDSAFDWNKEFKEIMSEGGFDVIVGNPPYGASLTENESMFLESIFKTYEYQANTYVLFYEQGLKLIKTKGVLGYITPSTFTYQHYFQKIRLLFSTLKIRNFAKYNYAVFDDADVGDTVSWVIEKSKFDNNVIKTLMCKNPTDAIRRHINLKPSEIIKSDGTYQLNSDGLPKRIFENPILGDISHIVVGIKPYQTGKGKPKQTKEIVKEKPFTKYENINPDYTLCIIGSYFHRYRFIKKPRMYLKYGDWLAEPRNNAPFYDNEKIIIRQTSDKIIAHLDTSKSLNLNNVYNISQKNTNFSIKYILGLLNSKLINRIYQNLSQEKGKLFAEVKKVYLNKIPIKDLSLRDQVPLVVLVDSILINNQTLFDYYLKFLNLIQSEFNIKKISSKLENWYELDCSDFVKEVEKSIKPQKLSLPQKSEWITHFESEKSKAVKLKNEIDQLDREIDQLVYKIYDLTPKEIELVELG